MRPNTFFNVLFLLACLLGTVGTAVANPTQYGDSGLFNQPTSETLNSGNICVGLWGDCSSSDAGSATVVPVAITLGLGSFLEAYGSYPNLLFNDKETASGRGYANVGFKLRLLGKRSSTFKLALDGQIRRTVSDDINYDGLTDTAYKAIVSVKPNSFGIHANAGMIKPGSPEYVEYDDQLTYGGGIEFSPTTRLRFLAEMGIETAKKTGLADKSEVMAGFQYFLSPHLTLNVAVGKGLSDVSPDWRTLIGFSSCQGIGTYQTPVERQVQKVEEATEKKPEKTSKIKTLSPLVPKSKPLEAQPTSSQFEVPVGEKPEEMILAPVAAPLPAVAAQALPAAVVAEPVTDAAVGSAATISPVAMATGVPLLQAAPQLAGAVAPATLPVGSALVVSSMPAMKMGRSYKLNDMVKSDDDRGVGKKVVDDPRYSAHFTSVAETPTHFNVKFFHKYEQQLDVWIEGADNVKHVLSKSKVGPYEDVTLSIEKVKGKVPYFKLHLGEHSEVFEFFPEAKTIKLGNVDFAVNPIDSSASAIAAPLLENPPATAVATDGALPVSTVPVIAAPSALATPVAATPVPPASDLKAATPVAVDGALPLSTAPVVAAPVAPATPSAVKPLVPAGETKVATPVTVDGALPLSTAPVVAAPVAPATPVAAKPPVPAGETKVATPVVIDGAMPLSSVTVVAPAAKTAPVAAKPVTPAGASKPAAETAQATPVVATPVKPVIKPTTPLISSPVATSTTTSTTAVAYRKFRLPANVTFAYDDDTLSEGGKKAILEVVEAVRNEKNWVAIRIDGFTDDRGSYDYNLKLGLNRAVSVGSFMAATAGVDPTAIFVRSSGEDDPIASNTTDEGRSLNRRAEILLFVPKD